MSDSTETIHQLQVDHLHESPFNPRRIFRGLGDLAANIKAEGRIHEPLLVRPRIGPLFGDDPAAAAGHEIVFGHRRYRAAMLAGLVTVPCMVRSMSDAEARSAQTAENLQREDVHPIEEAEGFQSMIDHDGLTVDELATEVGKSRELVYGRLKLLQACPEVRQACLNDEIGSEVALLIARLRTDRLQGKALAAIKADHIDMGDGGKKSYRQIRSLLAEKFTLGLKDAIFSTTDAALLPDAGSCTDCPKRSGLAVEFSDLVRGIETRWGSPGRADANLCTDPDCWDAKKSAHLVATAAALQASGKVVVTGNKARTAISATGEVKGDYIPLAKVKATLKSTPKGQAWPEIVTIQNPRDGKTVQAVRRSDLVAAGVMKAEPKTAAKSGRPDYAAEQRERDRRWQENEAKAKVVSQGRLALLHLVRQAAAVRARDTFDLRLVASAAVAGVGHWDQQTLCQLHGVKSMEALKKKIDTLDAAALTVLLMDCVLVDDVIVGGHRLDTKPGPLLALASHYGIDAKAALQTPAPPPPAGTSTPSTAGASQEVAKTAPAAKKTKAQLARAVRYRDPATGSTWSGRGLKPAWLRVALTAGKRLEDFEGQGQEVKDKAGSAGRQVTDDAGSAVEKGPRQLDMLEAEGAHA